MSAGAGGLVASEARRVRYRFLHVVGFAVAGVVVTAVGTFVYHMSNAYSPDDLRAAVMVCVAPLALAALVIGASMLGNDMATRALTTLLLYEPRRRRVLVARAGVCAVATAALALVVLTVLTLTLLPSLTTYPDAGWWASMATLAGRASLLVAAAAVTGVALAALTRGTLGALAATAGYAFLVEQPAAGFWPGLAEWLPISNAVSWVSGDGPHSTLVSGAVLVGLVAVLLAGADLAFRRQDIA